MDFANSDELQREVDQHSILYAAGFNAHGQLSKKNDEDLTSFLAIRDNLANGIYVLFAGWSSNVLTTGERIEGLGYIELQQTLDKDTHVKCGIGDENGMQAFIDQNGRLYTIESQNDPPASTKVSLQSHDDSPRLGQIARAGNGRVAVTFRQAQNSHMCHIIEFVSVQAFQHWFSDPSAAAQHPDKHHMLRGRPKEMLANTANFVLLMETGEVYTWGDPRLQTLGRPINAEEGGPADIPGLVEALGGLRISKIACGGWLSAALSQDGALYLWGTTSPGQKESIPALKAVGPGEIALVELSGSSTDPLDVLDVAVGDDHVAIIAEDHRLYVIGDNRYGQLGLDGNEAFIEDWQAVVLPHRPQNVFCGPKSTFVVAEESNHDT